MGVAWLKELSDEDRLRAIEEAFGKTAVTADGQVVVRFLFDELFEPIMNEGDRIRHNQKVEWLQLFPGAVERMYIALLQQET